MKKARHKAVATDNRIAEDDVLPEYDFSRARRNPYAGRMARDAVMVVLDADVARVFPDSASVNDALRALARIAERAPQRRRRRSKGTV